MIKLVLFLFLTVCIILIAASTILSGEKKAQWWKEVSSLLPSRERPMTTAPMPPPSGTHLLCLGNNLRDEKPAGCRHHLPELGRELCFAAKFDPNKGFVKRGQRTVIIFDNEWTPRNNWERIHGEVWLVPEQTGSTSFIRGHWWLKGIRAGNLSGDIQSANCEKPEMNCSGKLKSGTFPDMCVGFTLKKL